MGRKGLSWSVSGHNQKEEDSLGEVQVKLRGSNTRVLVVEEDGGLGCSRS